MASTVPGTTTARKPCHLLMLAAELRNRIYFDTVSDNPEGVWVNGNHESTAADGLAMSCKQIRAEILPVIDEYVKDEEIAFHVNVVDLDFTGLIHTYTRICRRASAEKTATLHVRLHIENIDRAFADSNLESWKDWLYLCYCEKSDMTAKRLYTWHVRIEMVLDLREVDQPHWRLWGEAGRVPCKNDEVLSALQTFP